MAQHSFGLIELQRTACQHSLSLFGSELDLFAPSTVELERTLLARVCPFAVRKKYEDRGQ